MSDDRNIRHEISNAVAALRAAFELASRTSQPDPAIRELHDRGLKKLQAVLATLDGDTAGEEQP